MMPRGEPRRPLEKQDLGPPAPHPEAIKAGLRYVTDGMPGIRREAVHKGFRYRYATGDVVTDETVLNRIKTLAIPPAWTEVWICPDPAGHLQATGRDARRRKQHRYHSDWRAVRDQNKYDKILQFAKALPDIRKRVARDLSLSGMPQPKVLAAVVRFLESTHIRIGNEEYAKENKSFGLTTIRNKHVAVRGDKIQFRFRGKSGKFHQLELQDQRLAKIVRECQDLPGQELFEYVDSGGQSHDIKSTHVNDYLREMTGQEITAKDFRTWAGTVLAGTILSQLPPAANLKAAKSNLSRAVQAVSERLGNTPAICRKCYVHPEVMAAYLDGSLSHECIAPGRCRSPVRGDHAATTQVTDAARELLRNSSRSRVRAELSPEERAVFSFLKRRLTRRKKAETRSPEQDWIDSIRLQRERSRGVRRRHSLSTGRQETTGSETLRKRAVRSSK